MRKQKLLFSPLTAAIALAAAGGITTPSITLAAPQLEEIIVTAQRREESLQDTPLAVTALSSEDLELRGMNGVEGLQNGAVPAINVQTFASRPGTMQISIRGVGISDAGQASFEQAVATYVDGVYLGRAQGAGLDVMELERMEVLRGPQGTLFGRNALGGAINMIAKKPSGEFRFKQTLDYGRFDSIKAKTVIETNEFYNVALKLDYQHDQTDGWMSNPAPGQEDFNTRDTDAWRLQARWEPSDNVLVDYAYDESDLDYTQGFNHLAFNSDTALAPYFAPYVTDGRLKSAPAPGLINDTSNNQISGHSITVEWDLSDDLTFKSISSYRETDVDITAVNGFGVLAPIATGFLAGNMSVEVMDQDQTSQEFQLIGSSDRLQYTVGAIYFNEQIESLNAANFTMFQSFNPAERPTLGPIVEGAPTVTEVDLESFALYGQATWTPDILEDRLDITLGLRYGKDNKSLLRTMLFGNPVNIPVEANEERVDPALTVNYQWSDNTSVYGRYATAYRGGGASVRETPSPLDPSDTGFHAFGAEEVKSYELGIKSDFWDRRARLNAAFFVQDVIDKQLSFQKPNQPSNTRLFNYNEDVRVKGADLELTVAATDNLTLTANGTWLFNDNNGIINPDTGNEEPFRLPQTPRLKWSTSAQYFLPVQPENGELNLFVSLSGSDTYCFNGQSCSGRFKDLKGGIGGGADDNLILDARLSLANVAAANGNINVALWGKNLLDKEYWQFGFTVPGLNTGNVSYGDPRTYGITVSYEYQ